MKTEQKNDLWVWVDLEMTGLDSSKCVIVEIASVVTDTELNIISLGPDIVVARTDQEMETLAHIHNTEIAEKNDRLQALQEIYSKNWNKGQRYKW